MTHGWKRHCLKLRSVWKAIQYQRQAKIVTIARIGIQEGNLKNDQLFIKIMDYKKYFNLDEYIFNKVGPRFRNEGTISVEDFFCIVIWKANRAKTNIKKKLSKDTTLENSVKEIAVDLSQSKDSKDKLQIMVNKWKFGLPMATAILTVLYPEEFTIYDYRVRQQLGLEDIYSVKRYFDYFLPAVKKDAKINNETLREADKRLWGKSFYKDLLDLVK
jgi:hypothetical protein